MLHDVMSGAGLSVFAEVALLIFFAAFVVAVIYVLRRPKGHYDAVANLPLEDDAEWVQRAQIDGRRRSRT